MPPVSTQPGNGRVLPLGCALLCLGMTAGTAVGLDFSLGDEFEYSVQWSEVHSVIELEGGSSACEMGTELEGTLSWTVKKIQNGGTTLTGVLSNSHVIVKEKLVAREQRSYDIQLQRVRLQAIIMDKAVTVSVAGSEWRNVLSSWRAKAKDIALSQQATIEVETAVLQAIVEACQIGMSFSLAGRGRGIDGIVVQRPLIEPTKKPSGTIVFKADMAACEVTPDGRTFDIPLKIARVKAKSVCRNIVEKGFLVFAPGSTACPFDTVHLEGTTQFSEPEQLKAIAEYINNAHQRYQFSLRLQRTGAAAPKLRPREHRRPSTPGFRGVLKEKDASMSRRLGQLKDDPDGLDELLEEYARRESGVVGSSRLRAALHYSLAEELAVIAYNENEERARNRIEQLIQAETRLPLVLVALRAVACRSTLLPDSERVRLFKLAALRHEARIAQWGGKFLGCVPWEGALEALSTLMKECAAKGNPHMDALARSLTLDLYRVVQPADEEKWRASIANDQEEAASRIKTGATTVVIRPTGNNKRPFGTIATYVRDAGGRKVAYVIDCSQSMRTNVTAYTEKKEEAHNPGARFFEWAIAELKDAVVNLPESSECTVLAFNDDCKAWSRQLRTMTKDAVTGAVAFIDDLTMEHGSDLRTVVPALERLDDVETVCIISDGGVCRTEEVEELFLVWNYLLGARVITYGFGSPSASEQIGILESLARSHYGVYNVIQGFPRK